MKKGYSILFLVLLLLNNCFGQISNSNKNLGQGDSNKIDMAEIIFDEILDKHEFFLTKIKDRSITIPLPVMIYSPQRGFDLFMVSRFHHGRNTYKSYKLIKNKIVAVDKKGLPDKNIVIYDFSLTRNVVQMIVSAALLFWIMMLVAKQYKKTGSAIAPKGFQNAIETVITFIRDEVAKSNLGNSYERYMPFLLAVFFFILINNLLGLIPFSAKVTGNIAVTFVLAFISLMVILFSSNRHYWSHTFWPSDIPFVIKLILVPVEFAGIFIRPAALMIRLFANMIAGHIIIVCFISLIFIFGAINKFVGLGFLPVSIGFTVFIYLLELLVAFLQAFIFTNLTAVFIGQTIGNDRTHRQEKNMATDNFK